MCNMVLKAKINVTGSLDTAPWGLDTAPCSGSSNEIKEKKQKPRHGGVSGEHGPCPVT
ncbi:hypothetical protein Hdeb2414_s0013g00406201 [Helianthus debilis subsp. tardiflorus]